jgi:4-hydroxybenzoate polyprenyltransferase/phosphoserine phosphatase
MVVDLDGTIIKTDLLYEAANQFVARRPYRLFLLMFWIARGRGYLKARLAEAFDMDVAALPYNHEVLSWLRELRTTGRRIVLATASHRLLAEQVAAHVNVFDEVLATEGDVNLKARAKRERLVARFGEGGFDYIGDSRADMEVWRVADAAVVVDSGSSVVRAVRATGKLRRVFQTRSRSRSVSMLRALRPHQWVKNLLVFVPLIASHQYGSIDAVLGATIAFVVFGITASSVYVLNDLVDVSNDRLHQRKRLRPFAAGDLSLLTGWLLWPALLVVAYAIALTALPLMFTVTLTGYFSLTVAYSVRLKQSQLVDVLALAALYTVRIIAGAAAIAAELSFWILALSMFLFLSLACMKRYSELRSAAEWGRDERLPGRGYYPSDLTIIATFGVAAGYIAALVLALYIQDSHAADLYGRPEVLWVVCPLILYWISRAWLFTHRGGMHDDPIVFALKDRISWYVGALTIAAFAIARVGA